MRRRERGFTLIELLIAIVLFVLVAIAMLGIARGFAHHVNDTSTSAGGALTLEGQIDDLRGQAATAFAVFVPDLDVYGRANVRPVHELDFYSKTDDGRNVFWAYLWDPAAQTLKRVDYDLANNVGVADRATGLITPGNAYPTLTGVTAFTARDLEADQLTDPSASAYAPVIAPLFTAAGRLPKPLPVGYDVGETRTRPSVYGGNTTVEVSIATAHAARTLHLATGALPSGFIVHAHESFRALVYRVDSTKRGCLGLCQRSRVYIKARILVSFDNFKTNQIWCDWSIYGYPGGLIPPYRDGVTDYHPDWFVESTAGLFYAVTHNNTPGATCPNTPPTPPSPHASAPATL